jgi:hypothetical protein
MLFQFLLYSILLAINSTVAQQDNGFHDNTHHFRLILPEGWTLVPSAALDELNQTLAEKKLTIEKYSQGFQPKDHIGLELPYILIQPHGAWKKTPTYDELETWLRLASVDRDGALEKLSDRVHDLDVEKGSLDRKRNRIVVRSNAEIVGGMKVKGIGFIYLTRQRMIDFYCYALAGDFEKMLPTFEKTLDSFKVDEGFAYDPNARNVDVANAEVGGLSAGVFIGIVAVVASIVALTYPKKKLKR